ncbi:hypothetical protein PENSPDRAFT_750174 [Peniophora sp. CONT]|nr:hypothetical protein PENSPDRAFT_750174 [Peniophora sp. CONT]
MAELPPPTPRIGGRAQLPDLDLLPPVGSVLPQRQRQQEPRGRYDFTPPQVPAAIVEDESLIHQGVLPHHGVFNNNMQQAQQAQLQGLPEDEVVPLVNVDENLVGEDAPAGGDQEHQDQDEDGPDENPEALDVPNQHDVLFLQHGTIPIEANGAPVAGVAGPAQQAAPAGALDVDRHAAITESPRIRSISLSLPPHIRAQVSKLAVSLSPDNAAAEGNLSDVLERAHLEILRLREPPTETHRRSARWSAVMQRGLNAITRGVKRAGKGWASLARKTKIGGNQATNGTTEMIQSPND